jgi:ATP-dependent 26S proteasome regulatory subunit
VLVNEAFVIVGDLGFETAGPVTKITEIMGKDRLRVGSEHGLHSMVLQRSSDLVHSSLKSGDEVRVDSNYRMALEMLSSPKSDEYYLDTVPALPWEKVGGQETALQAIKDAIELPLCILTFSEISTRYAERFSALRPAGLRQDAHRQGDCIQFDETTRCENRD